MLNNTLNKPTEANAIIKVAVTNLAAYNEGFLIYRWLELPATAEEIEATYKAVQRSECNEEFFITDYESDIYGLEIGEYDSVEKLNEIATAIDELNEYDRLLFDAAVGYHGLYEAMELLNSDTLEGYIYYDCDNMADVAEQVIEATGILDNVPEHLRYYFDYEAYGRDLDIEGIYVQMNDCIVELYR
jgi:antirestriction protein